MTRRLVFSFLLILFLFTKKNSTAQETVPFTTRVLMDEVKGDLVLTGNDIVGVILDNSGQHTTPNRNYNGGDSNGNYVTAYIDVDNDPNTFSSSMAAITAPEPSCSTLIYAGLYWSANYYMARANGIDNNNYGTGDIDSNVETNVRLYINNGPIAFDYNVRYADFASDNSDIRYNPVTSYLVVAQPENGCGSIANATALAGNIAVVREGGSCSLRQKVVNAETAGAVGVVIVSSTGNLPALTGDGTTINIPSVTIGNDDITNANYTNLDLITTLSAQTNVVLATLSTDGNDTGTVTSLPLTDPRKQGPADFRNIKFKVPGAVNYTNITATSVVFDGYRDTPTNPFDFVTDEVPYVCYADVTSLLDPDNYFGTYTVADMNATQGYTTGGDGACGGWMLVAVYENLLESTKQVNINDGFTQIFSTGPPVDFTYSGFTTLQGTEPVNVKYAVSSLEGDRGITGDELRVQNVAGNFVSLGEIAGTINPNNNFFNSSISSNGTYITDRTPNSQNTQGFDADIFDLPNAGNILIGNGQTSATFQLFTQGDRYSVFFNAFSVEINNQTSNPITQQDVMITPVICGGSTVVTDLGSIDLIIEGCTGSYNYTLVEASNLYVRPLVSVNTDMNTPNPQTTGTNVSFDGLDYGIYYVFVENTNDSNSTLYPLGPYSVFSPPTDISHTITVPATCASGFMLDIDILAGSGIIPPADPPPGFDIRIVGEPSPGLGDFVPCNDLPAGQTIVDATTAIRNHRYTGLEFNRTYTVEVRDNATGCLYQELIDAIAPPSEPEITNLVVENISCAATPTLDDGEISFDVSGYDPTSTSISWEVFNQVTNVSIGASGSGSVSVVSPASVPVTISNLPVGQYYVIVREDDGTVCPSRADFVIDIPNEVTVSVDALTHVSCDVDTIDVTISGTSDVAIATYYYIDNDDNQVSNGGSPVFIGLSEGQYQFLVEDVNGCQSQLSAVVPVIPINQIGLTLDLIAANVNCFNEALGIVDASVTGGIGDYVFSLTNNTTTQTSGPQTDSEFVNLPPGDYTYFVTSDGNCSVQQSFTIVNPPELVNIPPDATNVLCFGGENGSVIVFAEGGTPPYSFTISTDPGQFFADDSDNDIGRHTFTNLGPGNYQVFAQDANGCSRIYDITIDEPDELAVSIASITSESCFDADDGTFTIEVIGGTSPYFTNITNNDADLVQDLFTYTNLPGGITSVFITDSNGCRINLSVAIPDSIAIQLEVSPVTASQDGIITVSPSDGIAPYLYELLEATSSTVIIASQNSNILIVDTPGDYVVRVIDGNGCVSEELVTVLLVGDNPITDYAGEILHCTVTDQSYPVVTIQDQNGEVLEVPFTDVLSIVWQQLDTVSCNVPLDATCPTTDVSCTSDWFDIADGSGTTITLPGEYRIVITFNIKSNMNVKTYYFRVSNALNTPEVGREVIKMYPIPSTDTVSVNTEVKDIIIFDVSGKKILEVAQKQFSIENLQKGVYFARVNTAYGKTEVIKLIKK